MGEYIIKISPDGTSVDVDAKDFVGTECKDGINNVLKMLGNVEEEKKKDSYYKESHSGQQVEA